MLKLVIDTNVFISSLISKKGSPRKILDIVFDNKVDFFISAKILDEYKRVLSYKKLERFIKKEDREKLLTFIEKHAYFVVPQRTFKIIKDEDDNMFLDCAVESKADYIITGNTNDFTMSEFMDIKILTPTEFIMLNSLTEKEKV